LNRVGSFWGKIALIRVIRYCSGHSCNSLSFGSFVDIGLFVHKIRFATAIRDFSRKKGGAERYLVDLCKRMAAEDFEVHVYAERWDEEEEGVHCHLVRTISFPKSLRLLSFAARATRAIREGRYDVTLGVGNTLGADVLQPHGGVHWAWFWRSLKAYDNPFLRLLKLLGRTLSAKQWVSGWIEDAPYRSGKVRRLVAISEMVKQDMMESYHLTSDRITVVYNGVDIERFHPRNGQWREEIRRRHGIGEEFLILFVSNNYRMKGLAYLIRALSQMKKEQSPPFKLLVLGRDREAPYLRLAEGQGLSGDIVFAGSTDRPERYYGAADLLVHPTFYDACSLTVLEALASGLPVVTTSHNGAGGLLQQGEDGWVIQNPRDVDEIRMAIGYFLEDVNRQHARLRAREKAEACSEEANFARMTGIFREVSERRS
jgi:UDP-glucose:(heptosyl)LPS alpha-1,3-glucosyltransferase